MKNELLISIIIPVYNVEKYLTECLDSILCQNFQDCEIICIDDVSTDSSYEILCKYESENPSIRMFKNSENKGLSYTRNRGIKEAVGKYIMFVDSDDMLKEGALRQISQLLELYKDVDILYYDMEVRNEGKWAKEQCEWVLRDVGNITGELYTGWELYIELKKKDSFIVEACRQVVRRDFLGRTGILFYEGIYHEDNLFSFYCAMNASRVVYIAEMFYLYRRRDASIMSTINLKRVQSYFIVFIELWNYWKNGTWSEEINWLFEEYLRNIYKQFWRQKNYYPNVELKEFGTEADRFMYKCLTDNQKDVYEYITNGECLVSEAKKASKILIYGAGNVAIEVVRLLQSRGIGIDGIVVSDKKSNPDELFGTSIFEFGKYVIEDDTLVIIAIISSNKKAVDTIVKNIKKTSCARIIMYDGTLK